MIAISLRIASFGIAALGLATGAAAQDIVPFVGAHGAMTPGSFTGAGDRQQLDLWPDQAFHFSGDDGAVAGKWYADPTRGGIVLALPVGERVFEVRNSRTLRPMGASDDGSGDFVAAEAFTPALISLPITGMLTYFADAATLVHCATGRTHPVAQEADYLSLETAYLADRPGPAEPLFVSLDGRIEMRAQMEGPDRLTIVAETFTGAFPGEDCALGNRVLAPTDAVWTITSLGDDRLEDAGGTREPFLTFLSDGSGFTASVGCNLIRGEYTLVGRDLSFGAPLVSTMMACPDRQAGWEERLGEVLGEVRSYEIGGRTMRLLGQDNAVLAEFRAFYLP